MKIPPFCPNPECKHHEIPQDEAWFAYRGFYFIKQKTVRIQRFSCKTCGKSFGTRTFDVDYWTRKSLSYRKLSAFLSSSMSIRSLARNFGCSTGTIQNRISRLARQCLAVNALIAPAVRLKEDCAADGFESFIVSQYFPNNFTIAVGSGSQFVYALSYAQLRRKGRMTQHQKKTAALYKRLYPLPGNQITRSFSEITERVGSLLLASKLDRFVFATDEKREYRGPIRELAYLLRWKVKEFVHLTVSSSRIRDRENPLFPVNYMDREFRKDLAEHRRETVCFGRNTNCTMERMTVYLFYHNYLKPFRINPEERVYETHAAAAGIEPGRYRRSMRGMYRKRHFLGRIRLGGTEELVWRRAMITPKKSKMSYCPAYVTS